MNSEQNAFQLFGAESESLDAIVEKFDPARLRQARVLSTCTKSEVAKLVGVSAAAIGQYEAGVAKPRPDVLVSLARAVLVEPAFFATGRPLYPIDTGAAHFRSLRSVRASDRDKALATAEQVWELAHALEVAVRFPSVNLPKFEEGMHPAAAARVLRQLWQIPDGPFPHLVATMEANGVIVLVLEEGAIDRVDAFSTVASERPFVISTPRRSNNVYRHRFTCAHELGHLVLHDDAIPGDRKQEREADEFAAALLTPAEDIQPLLPARLELPKLERIGRVWGVSIDSLMKRMYELRMTSDTSMRRAYQKLNSDPSWRADEPWFMYEGESPSLLQQALKIYEDSGKSASDLAEQLKWKTSQIRELLGIRDSRPELSIVK